MPINNCKTHISGVDNKRLARSYAATQREAMEKPVQGFPFCRSQERVREQWPSSLQLSRDFAGCYVFLEAARSAPSMSGSPAVFWQDYDSICAARLTLDASLAYRMAIREMPTQLQRSEAMLDSMFKKVFDECQGRLRRLQVSFIAIENDLEIYLFEAFCAIEL